MIRLKLIFVLALLLFPSLASAQSNRLQDVMEYADRKEISWYNQLARREARGWPDVIGTQIGLPVCRVDPRNEFQFACIAAVNVRIGYQVRICRRNMGVYVGYIDDKENGGLKQSIGAVWLSPLRRPSGRWCRATQAETPPAPSDPAA